MKRVLVTGAASGIGAACADCPGHYGVNRMQYEVVLDSDVCVSAGRCVGTAPEFFVFDSDELVELADGPQPSNEVLLRIARSCPSGAIKLLLDGAEVEI